MKLTMNSIRNYFLYKVKLKFKFLFTFIIIIILPMLILSFSTYISTAKNLNDRIKYSVVQSFDQTLMSIENMIVQYDNLCFTISRSKVLPEIITTHDTEYSPNKQALDKIKLKETIYSLISRTNLSSIKLYFKDDFSYFTNGTQYYNISQVDTERWYQLLISKFINEKETVLFCPPSYLPENDTQDVKQLSIARVIINDNNYNDYIGLLRLDFPESYLLEILNKNNSIPGSLTYIQNFDGEVISTTDESLMNIYQTSKINYDISENQWLKIKINHKYYLINMQSIRNFNCNLVTILPYEQIIKPIYSIRSMIIIQLVVLIPIAFAFALLISFSMTNRILGVIKKMNLVKMGKLELINVEPSKDEIGELYESYNYMICEMKKLIKIQFEIGKEVKNAELNALQAQINPHFLYNTLDMINWFSAQNMHVEIRTAVIALAKFYKLSLSKGCEEISIKDEFTHITMYMQIQNLRYRDQIRFEIQVANELMNFYIVKTVLQPIVENAIIHGIMEKPDKIGHIIISCEETENDLIFSINDDGVGMSEYQLSRIFSIEKSNQSDDYHGYAIVNVQNRLKHFYGENYGLKYSSLLEKGTCVELKIPKTLNTSKSMNKNTL